MTNPTVTKHRVTMRSFAVAGVDSNGKPLLQDHEAVDFVGPDLLDTYVADAQTRWQFVEVSDEPDAGPGGFHGETKVPESLLTEGN